LETPAMSRRSTVALLPLFLAVALLIAPLSHVPCAADEPKEKEPASKTVTLKEDAIPLGKALAELKKQTDVQVEDRRGNKGDIKLKLDLNRATFWQALDAVAREADARVSLYEKDGRLALVDGPFREVPTSYSGIFRTTVKGSTGVLDLESDAHFYVVSLEVAWEPGFRPFYFETRPQSVMAEDDKKGPLQPLDDGSGRSQVEGRNAFRFNVRLPAVPRSVHHLGLLKGKAVMIGPKKWLTFTFDDLKAAEEAKEGVTVKLTKTTFEPDLWTLDVGLEYPREGPKFESFESWVVYNEIHLVKKDDPEKRLDNSGYETGNSAGTKASLSYHFDADKNMKPGDWKLVYQTPGPFNEIPVSFEFKDLPLP
jgi:hypothetical protein